MENTVARLQRINSVSINGTVGSEEAIHRNDKNTMVAFSLAQYVGKNRNGEKITVWHRVKAFTSDKTPIDLNLVRKGMKLIIKGHYEGRTYTNKEGKTAVETYIVADSLEENVPVEYVPVNEYETEE